jgi:hypothetical protein
MNLGDKVKDRVTGLTGIVVAYTTWINGCIRLTIQPQEIKDGEPVKTSTFDIEELSIVEAGAVQPKKPNTNGPMPSVRGDR